MLQIALNLSQIKVLYVSGYGLPNLAAQGFPVDRINAFLQKPFSPAVLASRVSELFDPPFQ